jgi:site-specific recombinase XerD
MAKRVPLPVLQKLMGHSDLKTTLRYIDVNEDQKREAIAAVFGATVRHVSAESEAKSS